MIKSFKRLRPVLAALALASAVRAAPPPAPVLTVASLFSDVISGLDEQLEAGQWRLIGAYGLIEWPQGDPVEKAAGLKEVSELHRFIPVQPLTECPVRLDTGGASRAFFRGVPDPPGGVPWDGSWIGYKYVFFPNSVVDATRVVGGVGEPIPFYLVRPAPEDLAEADLALPLTEAAEARLLADRREAYDWYHQALDRIRRHHVSDALVSLICSAGAGCCEAQVALARHELRRGTPEALSMARHYFELAARQHDPEARREAEHLAAPPE